MKGLSTRIAAENLRDAGTNRPTVTIEKNTDCASPGKKLLTKNISLSVLTDGKRQQALMRQAHGAANNV